MQSFLFSRNFDTTLIPVCRNLSIRNGVYYYRQQINGKRIYKSLHTSDPYVAVFLLRQILSQNLSNTPIQSTPIISSFRHINSASILAPKKTLVKHDIVKTWDSLQHQCKNEIRLRNNRAYIIRVAEFLGCRYIEDLAAQPDLIYTMINKFRDTPIQAGTHKGKTISAKTLKNYLLLLRQVINHAADREWIDNADKLISKLQIRKIKGFGVSIRREPLSEPDFEKLFECLDKLLHQDTTFLNQPINLSSAELNRVDTIKRYPIQISYVILICLFTGSRACGAITIRHKDVNCRNKTITISRNETIIQQGDLRETYKKLKTMDSERKIPIATVLEELGLIEYIKRHELRCGSQAFIFEEVIQNKNKQGYRPKVMNECVNVLFKVIGIKPHTNDQFLLDMHSLKESFYSHNEQNVSKDMLEAIAGNKPSGRGISSRVYNKQSFDRLPMKMIHAVNLITYPHLNLLFSGQLPDNLKHLEYDYKAS